MFDRIESDSVEIYNKLNGFTIDILKRIAPLIDDFLKMRKNLQTIIKNENGISRFMNLSDRHLEKLEFLEKGLSSMKKKLKSVSDESIPIIIEELNDIISVIVLIVSYRKMDKIKGIKKTNI